MARQWIIENQRGFLESLEFRAKLPLPTADQLGDKDVLVALHAASLNYRDLALLNPKVPPAA